MPCFYPRYSLAAPDKERLSKTIKFFSHEYKRERKMAKYADNRLIGGLICDLTFFYINQKEQFRIFKSKNIQKSLIAIDKIPEFSVVCEKSNRKNL